MLGIETPGDEMPRVRSYLLALIGTAGVAYCITSLWLGMRLVMDVGGYCASGNSAYVIQQQCPDGAALLVAPAVPLGFVFGAVMAWGFSGISKGGTALVFLFWPALFLSLGFNFLQGAFNPPGSGGLEIGWLICGIVFVLMGAPALFAIPGGHRALQPRRGQSLALLLAGALIGIWLANRVANAVA